MYGVETHLDGPVTAIANRQKARKRFRVWPDDPNMTRDQRLGVRDLAMHDLQRAGWPMERIAVAFDRSYRQVFDRLKSLKRCRDRL